MDSPDDGAGPRGGGRHGWTPFPFQEAVWHAYLARESGLIHAATGTGKTSAAWLGPVLEWLRDYPVRPRREVEVPPPLRVLWITPLRALAGDTEAALRAPVEDFGLPWTIESRTGDTPAKVRARQRDRLPTALVTTPESLSLLLTRDDAPALFAHLELVVVDEWHELLASKRGVQTELALARLRRFRPGLRTLGLSATLGNLGGSGLLPAVIAAIEEGESALVFTNTRATAEIWYQALLAARPEWAGIMALLRTCARRLVVLGDLFHARAGRIATRTIAELRRWRGLRSELEIVLVRGHHDRHAGDPPEDLRINCVDAPAFVPPFVLRHDPGDPADGYTLAGHLHPGIVLTGPALQRERLPCFWLTPRMAVLPAFGSFTGLAPIMPAPDDRIFAIAEDEVVPVG